MRPKIVVPSWQKMMPSAVQALNELGGIASYSQVLYKVLLNLDLPIKGFEKAEKNMSFIGTYLRKFGILKNDSKKGTWELEKKYLDMEQDEVADIIKEKYKEMYQR